MAEDGGWPLAELLRLATGGLLTLKPRGPSPEVDAKRPSGEVAALLRAVPGLESGVCPGVCTA